jgi:hypothetical protein
MNSAIVPASPASHTEVCVSLNASAEQLAQLVNLQKAFAQVCNALAPVVQQTRCWNRVTLHHLTYRGLREKFPAMGSQMVCNAIYSVSRTSRMLFQHPASPFNISRLEGKSLPLLKFTDTCPVYFDRHTLSVKDGRLSMYTLDGRVRFDVALAHEHELAFKEKKLREVVLSQADGGYELRFRFAEPSAEDAAVVDSDHPAQIPEYVVIEESHEQARA